MGQGWRDLAAWIGAKSGVFKGRPSSTREASSDLGRGDQDEQSSPPQALPAPWGGYASWIFGFLVFGGVVALLLHLGDFDEIRRLSQEVHAEWLLPALLAQAATYVCAAAVWKLFLERSGHPQSLLGLVPLGLAKLFTDQAVPPSGVSGALIVFRGLMRRGAPSHVAAAAVLLAIIAYYAAFLAVIGCSLGLLVAFQLARPSIVAAIAIVAVVSTAIPAAIIFGRTYGSARLRGWTARLPGASALFETAEGPTRLWRDPVVIVVATALQIGIFLLDAVTLWVTLFAFGIAPPFWVAFVSYVVANVVAAAAFVPLGLGTFEVGCIGTLTYLGVPLEAAFASAMALRGLTSWLPMAPGLWFARQELLASRS